MAQRAAIFRIEGRVQGVGYRWWAVAAARSRGLRGWVRNRREGWVELFAAGEPAAVDDLVRACAAGPPAAQVSSVARVEARDDGSVVFEERPTV